MHLYGYFLYHLPLGTGTMTRVQISQRKKITIEKETKRLHSCGWPTRADSRKINKINFLSRKKYISIKRV